MHFYEHSSVSCILHPASCILPEPPFDSPAHDVIEIALQSRIPQHTRSSHAADSASTATPGQKKTVPIFFHTAAGAAVSRLGKRLRTDRKLSRIVARRRAQLSYVEM
jgi:hypothetical protein